MTVSGPKVRDFTERRRTLPVKVDADPVYELLLALFALQEGMDLSEYTEGSMLIERLEAHGDTTLMDDMAATSACGELWLALLGFTYDLPKPRSIGTLIDTIEATDPIELRRLLLHNVGISPARGFDEADIDAAAAGDREVISTVFADPHHDQAMVKLFEATPAETTERIASLLRRFTAAVGDWLLRNGPILERDAESTSAMARTMSPARLVEKATNGITFEMQPQVSGVLLIPSVILRPWVVVTEHGTLRVFCYSVADEIVEGDPDAPPAYMVEVFKALGDERRLRILGLLAEGDLGLREVADRVDLAKSTAHHHLRILRSAGLVRITVTEDDKRYGLRRDSVPEVSRLLESFLTSHEDDAHRKDNL